MHIDGTSLCFGLLIKFVHIVGLLVFTTRTREVAFLIFQMHLGGYDELYTFVLFSPVMVYVVMSN